MVNNLVFRWPKPVFFMVLGAHGMYTYSSPMEHAWSILANRVWVFPKKTSTMRKVANRLDRISWQPCSVKPGTKAVKLLVGPTCKIPRSTQRSCSGIRLIPKMCQDILALRILGMSFLVSSCHLF